MKIGSNVLVRDDGTLDVLRLEKLVGQIAHLRGMGCNALVVTSGAIASGWSKLGLAGKPADLALKQASAAAGQSALMRHYEELFGRHGICVAQVLLTQGDLLDRRASLLRVLRTLLERGVIPVINENDAVSAEELAPVDGRDDAWMNFGDNDTLAAAIACEMKADLLVLLTNVDGIYDRFPVCDGSKLIRRVGFGERIEHLASGASTNGRGGMLSKIRAARKAAENGVTAVIANGNTEGILEEVVSGRARCTVFEPQGREMLRAEGAETANHVRWR